MQFFRYLFTVFYLGTLTGCPNPTQISEPHPQVAIPEKWSALGETALNETETVPDGTTLGGTVPKSTDPDTPITGAVSSAIVGAQDDTRDDTQDNTNTRKSDLVPSWLADFEAPILHTLVEEAVGKNFDLDAAIARVRAARARARREGAEKLPEFTGDLSASRARSGLTGTVSNTFALGIEVSWEADLWDRLDSAARAAVARVRAEEGDYRMARLSLAANVARTWFEAIESDQQLHLAEKTIASFENSLGTIERRYRLGIGSALDVRLARENVATARSQRETRARNRDTAVRSLEILLGRYPSGTLNIQRDLPKLRRNIPVDLPSDLLDRRPDVIAANARLLAARHGLATARANRLPRLRLTASGGTASSELHDLLRLDSLAWNLLGGLTRPLWDGGRLSSEVDIARADRREADAKYAAVVLRAFREVESALTAEALLLNQEVALGVATREARAASALAMEQYRQGLSDIVTLLSTQRREFDARSSLLAVAKRRLNTRVDLYLALGGGFQTARK
uniref:Efflux transporter, outer membrane factor (OMF) lipoprotein, NodT family n=1 Tax=Candidatus Kentrum sp. LFY TaxID=2126342 RepID=A0A450UCS0_9GAMM|nr:MAG: efflux transporter, outer membrane factor (OMF) lipoprotein, NodT family [Candidatus Kentron sp. LFY]